MACENKIGLAIRSIPGRWLSDGITSSAQFGCVPLAIESSWHNYAALRRRGHTRHWHTGVRACLHLWLAALIVSKRTSPRHQPQPIVQATHQDQLNLRLGNHEARLGPGWESVPMTNLLNLEFSSPSQLERKFVSQKTTSHSTLPSEPGSSSQIGNL
jgi:hypothetical protein